MLSNENYELLKSYCSPRIPNTEERERFKYLENKRLITIYDQKTINLGSFGTHLAPDKWIITELGKDALAEFEKERNKEAEHKRQQRFQNKISIASVLVMLITFFIGLVVEYFIGVFGWLFNFFH